jgi:RNA polymerase sigma factor FliA
LDEKRKQRKIDPRGESGEAAPDASEEQVEEPEEFDEEILEEDLADLVAEGDEEAVRETWMKYSQEPSQELRDILIEHYMWIVDKTAERLAMRVPPIVDIEDLRMAGALGLIDAIEKFDPSRGIKFETYCTRRLYGAMVDDLRRYDWVPRLIRNRTHQFDRARDELETRLKRRATPEELAEHMDMTMEEYESLMRELDVKTMVSLDRKWDDDDDNDLRHLEVLTDTRQCSPLEDVQRNEIKALAIRGLSDKEKAILQMYYFDNLKLKEIGKVLQISESRVCQIHQQTLQLLREKFESREVGSL